MSQESKIIKKLRDLGYRITPQREIIINAISRSPKHMSAEEVYIEVKKITQALNLATVYRTLDMLWEEGLICRNDLGEGRIFFSTHDHGPHLHLVCRNCSKVIQASPEILNPLGEILQEKYSFAADLDHLSIFGECAACNDTPSDPPS